MIIIFFFHPKNTSIYNSEHYNATLKAKETKGNKIILYEDSIWLKTKISKLKKELVFAKNNNRKKDKEIKQREKALEMAKNKLIELKTYWNLEEINIII